MTASYIRLVRAYLAGGETSPKRTELSNGTGETSRSDHADDETSVDTLLRSEPRSSQAKWLDTLTAFAYLHLFTCKWLANVILTLAGWAYANVAITDE